MPRLPSAVGGGAVVALVGATTLWLSFARVAPLRCVYWLKLQASCFRVCFRLIADATRAATRLASLEATATHRGLL